MKLAQILLSVGLLGTYSAVHARFTREQARVVLGVICGENAAEQFEKGENPCTCCCVNKIKAVAVQSIMFTAHGPSDEAIRSNLAKLYNDAYDAAQDEGKPVKCEAEMAAIIYSSALLTYEWPYDNYGTVIIDGVKFRPKIHELKAALKKLEKPVEEAQSQTGSDASDEVSTKSDEVK